MARHVSFAGLITVDICALFFVPVVFVDTHFKHFTLLEEGIAFIDLQFFGHICHHRIRPNQKHLFGAYCPTLVYIRPVNKCPIIKKSFDKAILVQTRFTEKKKLACHRVYTSQKLLVAIRNIMLVQRDDPEQTVIQDGIYVLLNRELTDKANQRSLVNFFIGKQVSVYSCALISVTCPYPSVSFYAIKKSFSAIKMECICCDGVYIVKKRIFAPEAALCLKRKIFIVGRHLCGVRQALQIDISESSLTKAIFLFSVHRV